jgi:hypothetical protein
MALLRQRYRPRYRVAVATYFVRALPRAARIFFWFFIIACWFRMIFTWLATITVRTY